jgi:hypothetical protein
MPTIVGLVFFAIGAYCFVARPDSLFGALILASVFEASSAINIGERGVQPYYIIAGFIILRGALNWLFSSRPQPIMPQRLWLLLFGSIAIASSFVLPIIFAGIPVYDPKIGIDPGLFIRPPLRFGLNNVGQAGFLAWHIATAFAVTHIQFSPEKTRKAYDWAFRTTVLFVFLQAAFQFIGIPFPDSLIRNNPGYAITDSTFGANGIRNSGTFTEPSIVGAFLLFFCVGYAEEFLEAKRGPGKMLIALAGLGAVASSGSLLATGILFTCLLIRHFPVRSFRYIRVRALKRTSGIVLLLTVPLFLVLVAPAGLRDVVLTLTVSKGESSSFINRTAADLYALELLVRTKFIGVGLGSNRASSLLTTLASNVGLPGIAAFLIFHFRLFANLPQHYAWLRWAAYALLLNMVLGIADVTIPIYWIAVLLAVTVTVSEGCNRETLVSKPPTQIQTAS